MKQLLARLREIHGELPFWQQVTSERAQDALAAAFLHDVGHGPLSHLFEDAIPGTPHHEEWTERIILDPSTGRAPGARRASIRSMPGARRRARPRRASAAVPRARRERHARRRPLRLPAPRRALDRRALRRLRSRLAASASLALRPPGTARSAPTRNGARPASRSTARRACPPSRRSSSRASSCSSRSTSTRRRGRRSG